MTAHADDGYAAQRGVGFPVSSPVETDRVPVHGVAHGFARRFPARPGWSVCRCWQA